MEGNIKFIILFLIIILVSSFVFIEHVEARSGCCSWHGGVSRCDTSVGRYVCNDGTYSPSCRCLYKPLKPFPTPKPTPKASVYQRIEDSRSEYYKNPNWFREGLISRLMVEFGSQNKGVIFGAVYALLPDVKD